MPIALAVLNGASSLAFEILWFRMLADVLGAGSGTLAVVLAAWMTGQALGSLAVSRARMAALDPRRLYALAEALAALSGLALVPLVAHLPFLSSGGLGIRACWAWVMLLPPTVCMGATFPLLCRFGGRIGAVFGFNVLGAAAGCVLSAWVLIPSLGLSGGSAAVSAMKLALALGALAAIRAPASGVPVPSRPGGGGADGLALSALLGFCGLAAQGIWTRMLTLLFSNAVFALAMILVVFFLGLGLGAFLSSPARILAGGRNAAIACLAGLFALGCLVSVRAFGTFMEADAVSMELWEAARRQGYLTGYLVQGMAMMLLPTVCLGAAFPLLAEDRPGPVYAANTLGGLAGCLAAPFLLLPLLGRFQAVLGVLAGLSLAGGLACLVARRREIPVRGWAAFVLTLLAAAAFASLPGGSIVLDRAVMNAVNTRVRWSDGRMQEIRNREMFDVVRHEEGRSCTTTVLRDKRTGDQHLLVDGFFIAGTGPNYDYMRVEGHLPALLCRDSGRALVVGFGTGSTLGALSLHPFRSLDVVEIAPEVLRTAPCFEKVNRKALSDPRVRVILDDARSALAALPDRYDLITCEPPIPYLSGGSALFTREFYAACRSRLGEGGVFCQWVPQTLYEEDSRLLIRTFQAVFPETSLWFVRNTILLLGTARPLEADLPRMAERLAGRGEVRRELIGLGLECPEALIALRWTGPKGAARYAGRGEVLTADRPVLEYYAGRGPVRDSMARSWRTLQPCREDPGAAVGRWEADGPEILDLFRDLQTCAYDWNLARYAPFRERPERFRRIAQRARLILPEGMSAQEYFDGVRRSQ